MPRIYLTNLASDVSGYKLALVDMKSPLSAAVATSVTNTSGSGDNIAATDTAGGTALKWITKPFLNAVTLATKVNCSIWAKESNASANAGVGIALHPYSAGSEGSVFLDHNDTVEAGTTIAAMRFTTVAATSQAFAIGDRLVIKLQVVAVGTMGGSQTVTIDYDGPTATATGGDGDTYIDILENFRVNERQILSGDLPYDPGVGGGGITRFIDSANEFIGRGYFDQSASVRSAIDIMTFERNILSPRTAQTTPTP